MLGNQLALQAVLIVFGGIWCKEVLGRLRADVAELRGHSDWTERAPTIIIWVLTVGVGAWMIRTVWGISLGLLAAV